MGRNFLAQGSVAPETDSVTNVCIPGVIYLPSSSLATTDLVGTRWESGASWPWHSVVTIRSCSLRLVHGRSMPF